MIHGLGPEFTDTSRIIDHYKDRVNIGLISVDTSRPLDEIADIIIKARQDARISHPGQRVLFAGYSYGQLMHRRAILKDENLLFKGDLPFVIFVGVWAGSPQALLANESWVDSYIRLWDRFSRWAFGSKPKYPLAAAFSPFGKIQEELFSEQASETFLSRLSYRPIAVGLEDDFNGPHSRFPFFLIPRLLGLLSKERMAIYLENYNRGLNESTDRVMLKGKGVLAHYSFLHDDYSVPHIFAAIDRALQAGTESNATLTTPHQSEADSSVAPGTMGWLWQPLKQFIEKKLPARLSQDVRSSQALQITVVTAAVLEGLAVWSTGLFLGASWGVVGLLMAGLLIAHAFGFYTVRGTLTQVSLSDVFRGKAPQAFWSAVFSSWSSLLLFVPALFPQVADLLANSLPLPVAVVLLSPAVLAIVPHVVSNLIFIARHQAYRKSWMKMSDRERKARAATMATESKVDDSRRSFIQKTATGGALLSVMAIAKRFGLLGAPQAEWRTIPISNDRAGYLKLVSFVQAWLKQKGYPATDITDKYFEAMKTNLVDVSHSGAASGMGKAEDGISVDIRSELESFNLVRRTLKSESAFVLFVVSRFVNEAYGWALMPELKAFEEQRRNIDLRLLPVAEVEKQIDAMLEFAWSGELFELQQRHRFLDWATSQSLYDHEGLRREAASIKNNEKFLKNFEQVDRLYSKRHSSIEYLASLMAVYIPQILNSASQDPSTNLMRVLVGLFIKKEGARSGGLTRAQLNNISQRGAQGQDLDPVDLMPSAQYLYPKMEPRISEWNKRFQTDRVSVARVVVRTASRLSRRALLSIHSVVASVLMFMSGLTNISWGADSFFNDEIKQSQYTDKNNFVAEQTGFVQVGPQTVRMFNLSKNMAEGHHFYFDEQIKKAVLFTQNYLLVAYHDGRFEILKVYDELGSLVYVSDGELPVARLDNARILDMAYAHRLDPRPWDDFSDATLKHHLLNETGLEKADAILLDLLKLTRDQAASASRGSLFWALNEMLKIPDLYNRLDYTTLPNLNVDARLAIQELAEKRSRNEPVSSDYILALNRELLIAAYPQTFAMTHYLMITQLEMKNGQPNLVLSRFHIDNSNVWEPVLVSRVREPLSREDLEMPGLGRLVPKYDGSCYVHLGKRGTYSFDSNYDGQGQGALRYVLGSANGNWVSAKYGNRIFFAFDGVFGQSASLVERGRRINVLTGLDRAHAMTVARYGEKLLLMAAGENSTSRKASLVLLYPGETGFVGKLELDFEAERMVLAKDGLLYLSGKKVDDRGEFKVLLSVDISNPHNPVVKNREEMPVVESAHLNPKGSWFIEVLRTTPKEVATVWRQGPVGRLVLESQQDPLVFPQYIPGSDFATVLSRDDHLHLLSVLHKSGQVVPLLLNGQTIDGGIFARPYITAALAWENQVHVTYRNTPNGADEELTLTFNAPDLDDGSPKLNELSAAGVQWTVVEPEGAQPREPKTRALMRSETKPMESAMEAAQPTLEDEVQSLAQVIADVRNNRVAEAVEGLVLIGRLGVGSGTTSQRTHLVQGWSRLLARPGFGKMLNEELSKRNIILGPHNIDELRSELLIDVLVATQDSDGASSPVISESLSDAPRVFVLTRDSKGMLDNPGVVAEAIGRLGFEAPIDLVVEAGAGADDFVHLAKALQKRGVKITVQIRKDMSALKQGHFDPDLLDRRGLNSVGFESTAVLFVLSDQLLTGETIDSLPPHVRMLNQVVPVVERYDLENLDRVLRLILSAA